MNFVKGATSAQYFIEVVPTDVYSFMTHWKTFQYSVKENIRPIDHGKGSHGMPGLYFKYDVSALKVIVKQDQESFMSFLIRISSVIAGIIVISGILLVKYSLTNIGCGIVKYFIVCYRFQVI